MTFVLPAASLFLNILQRYWKKHKRKPLKETPGYLVCTVLGLSFSDESSLAFVFSDYVAGVYDGYDDGHSIRGCNFTPIFYSHSLS